MQVLPENLWDYFRSEMLEYREILDRQLEAMDKYYWGDYKGEYRDTLRIMLRYTLGFNELVEAVKDGTGTFASDTLPDVVFCEVSFAAPMSIDQFNTHKAMFRDDLANIQDLISELDKERYYPVQWRDDCQSLLTVLAGFEQRIVSLYLAK